jgi:hypothetical protein
LQVLLRRLQLSPECSAARGSCLQRSRLRLRGSDALQQAAAAAAAGRAVATVRLELCQHLHLLRSQLLLCQQLLQPPRCSRL